LYGQRLQRHHAPRPPAGRSFSSRYHIVAPPSPSGMPARSAGAGTSRSASSEAVIRPLIHGGLGQAAPPRTPISLWTIWPPPASPLQYAAARREGSTPLGDSPGPGSSRPPRGSHRHRIRSPVPVTLTFAGRLRACGRGWGLWARRLLSRWCFRGRMHVSPAAAFTLRLIVDIYGRHDSGKCPRRCDLGRRAVPRPAAGESAG